jgi:hypothetical protein
MDTSFWTQLNKTVKIKSTKKLFHDKYAYKLKIFAPGARLLRNDSDLSYKERLTLLIEHVNQFYGKSYYFNIATKSKLKEGDPQQLMKIKKLMDDNPDVKTRIEEPSIIFYSNDLEKLKTIAAANYNRIDEIHLPMTDDDHQILLDGKIIASKFNDYKFKITLSPLYDRQLISAFQNVIENSDLSLFAKRTIIRQIKTGYYPGGYIHTNDEKIAFILNLIRPKMVRKIYSVVSSTNK